MKNSNSRWKLHNEESAVASHMNLNAALRLHLLTALFLIEGNVAIPTKTYVLTGTGNNWLDRQDNPTGDRRAGRILDAKKAGKKRGEKSSSRPPFSPTAQKRGRKQKQEADLS